MMTLHKCWRIGCGLLVACLIMIAPVEAQETILAFDSEITVHRDGTMTVREYIKVRAEGQRIKRGIYRDFPTRYRDRYGNRYQVRFEVLSVTRDGHAEAYHTKALDNGVRVYMGREGHLLSPGEYDYTLVYSTNRQLGYFEIHDELYWNVTGNGWDFTIEQVTARITLPTLFTRDVLRLDGYTGPQGAKDQDYMVEIDNTGRPLFSTTRQLNAREGLTIAVGWPKGHVAEPTWQEQAGYLLDDNRNLLYALGGVIILVAYYLFIWHRVGRDPRKGAIIPGFEPPSDLSPASMRYIHKMGFDKQGFAAAILNLAVKGYLIIHKSNGSYSLSRRKGGSETVLSRGERQLVKKLFAHDDSIALKNKNHATFSKAILVLEHTLKSDYHKVYFFTNSVFLSLGILITIITLLVSGLTMASDIAGFLFMSVWLSGWSFAVYMLFAARQYVMALPFAVFECFGLFAMTEFAGLHTTLLLIMLVAINILFYYLLKAPTRSGRKVMDQVEGFKMYLEVAEQPRLQVMHPPELTPELFERYLPYALALDVEQQWAEKFAAVLERAQYQPGWYSGSDWRISSNSSFISGFGSSLTSSIASASTAPGSSSGGGGGGSSGGGGGGGGGGGW